MVAPTQTVATQIEKLEFITAMELKVNLEPLTHRKAPKTRKAPAVRYVQKAKPVEILVFQVLRPAIRPPGVLVTASHLPD